MEHTAFIHPDDMRDEVVTLPKEQFALLFNLAASMANHTLANPDAANTEAMALGWLRDLDAIAERHAKHWAS